MALDEFDYSKSYNFSGIFWFENEFENRLSGTLEYTPEKGILLSLSSVALERTSYLLFRNFCAIQKMYGTVQYNGNSINITLIDVMLCKKSDSFGKDGFSSILEGRSRFLISNIHLKKNNIKSLNLEYDDCFKSIFFYHTSPEEVSEILSYTKQPIKLSNASISFDVFYTQSSMYHADQLDDILCDTVKHKKSSPMNELKEIVTQFLENHKHEIGIRKKPRSVIKIKGRISDIRRYVEIENKWRSFFELIIDKPITIKNACIGVEFISDNGQKYKTYKPILFQQYPMPTRRGANWHKFHLPITIDTFLGKNDLSKLQKPYEKWDKLYDDKKWKIVINGIKSIIYKDKLIGNEDFIILFSYIQTVMNILEYEKDNEEKPFATICNYLNKSASSIIKRKKPISGWMVYISELTVYEDVLGKMGIERKQLEPKILMAIADILQYSFLIKPEYGFICADETLPESLQFAEFKKFGQVGQTTVFIKNFK